MATAHAPTLSRSSAYAYCMSTLRLALGRGANGQSGSLDDAQALFTALDDNQLAIAARDIRDRSGDDEWLGKHPDAARLRELLADIQQRADTPSPQELEVSSDLLQRLVLAGTAYALGSMTYMVGWQADMATAHARDGQLTAQTLTELVEMISARKALHDARSQLAFTDGADSAHGLSVHERQAHPDRLGRMLFARLQPNAAGFADAAAGARTHQRNWFVSGELGMAFDYERWVQCLRTLEQVAGE